MNYSQLTQAQRYQIYALMKMGCTPTQIAEIVGVHKSTISRELKRNKGKRGYRPQQAQRMAKRRHNQAKKRLRPEDWAIIDGYLRNDLSPEQVSHWALKEHGIQVSHEWI